jgi:uncharacterized repeat protein (TIGR03803 family)
MKYVVVACIVPALLAGCAHQGAGSSSPSELLPQVVPASIKTLYAFPHRAFPHARLLNVSGTLYGTATVGGPSGLGFAYSVTPNGTEKLLHSYKGGSDGAQPEGGLIEVNGTLYGTTYLGGSSTCKLGCGTVFGMTTSGTENVIYRFTKGSDGQFPDAGLIAVGGTLYGTTYEGGSGNCSVQGRPNGCGTVFSVTASGTEKVLYSFANEADGEFPEAPLTESNGVLYGTTYLGGLDAQGTVFRINAGKKTIVHNFGAGTDGANPQSALFDDAGTLYGTTVHGGNGKSTCRYACGTVFSLTPSGKETILHSFDPKPDGAGPSAALIEVDGTFLGTTRIGGKNNAGTVFSLTPAGKENVLWSFTGGNGGLDPYSSLINVDGTLYGTTYSGGVKNDCCGTVFSLSP